MTEPAGPRAKTERLLNLVMALLWTRRPMTKAQLRAVVPAYGHAPSDEAFERMFERDKDELRELGIPLVTEDVSTLWDDEQGYRIHQRDYALPDLTFEPDELAALGLASRAWEQAQLGGSAVEAIRKLRAAGVEADEASVVGVVPSLRTPEEAFGPLQRAVAQLDPVAFDYRRPDGSTSRRSVQPWGLVHWHGHWYLTGFDAERQDARVFRLSRVVGKVSVDRRRRGSYAIPAGHDALATVSASAGGSSREARTATVRVRTGGGNSLRRQAEGEVEHRGDGWDRFAVRYTDVDLLATEAAAHGPDVVVEEPAELVAAVVARLRGVLGEGR